MELKLSSRY